MEYRETAIRNIEFFEYSCKNKPGNQWLLKEYIPIRVMQTSVSAIESFPLLNGKNTKKPLQIYVYIDYFCQKPVETVKEIKSMLK